MNKNSIHLISEIDLEYNTMGRGHVHLHVPKPIKDDRQIQLLLFNVSNILFSSSCFLTHVNAMNNALQ